MSTTMAIKIVSDVVCPFCYLGKLKLETALGQYKSRYPDVNVQITWLPYQLDPTRTKAEPKAKLMAEKFGAARAQELDVMMKANFAKTGANFTTEGLRGPTLDAHRLIDHVQSKQPAAKTNELVMALFKAFFGDARDISNIDTLTEIASEVGLDKAEISAYLQSDANKQKIAEEALSAAISGINGVPHFTFNDKTEVHGAQDPSAFYEALRRAT